MSFDYNKCMTPTPKEFIGRLREPVNGLTHLAAAAASLVGLLVLIAVVEGDGLKRFSIWIYGLALLAMFSASGAYHSIRANPKWIALLRKLDHSAIFFLIAGTYTPITIEYFEGAQKLILLGAVWGIAVAGIAIKLSGIPMPRWASTAIYLAMGWLALAGIGRILSAMPLPGLLWLAAGGLLFTVGALIYASKWPNLIPGRFGFHELWHVFVVLGAASHYVLIAGFVAP